MVKTANIDAIAADGTLFENFHVALPVCMPNRASLMTGRMPSVHGLRHNEVMIEHNDGGPRMGFKQAARARTLRTKHWRFSVCAGEEWGELYDLTQDPKETDTLWSDPAAAAVKAALSLRLIEHLTYHQMDQSPRATRLAQGQHHASTS